MKQQAFLDIVEARIEAIRSTASVRDVAWIYDVRDWVEGRIGRPALTGRRLRQLAKHFDFPWLLDLAKEQHAL